MSENVVDGLSVVYALARLRPMDMTLPIWPAARRCIHMKKPISRTSGNSRLAQLSSQFELGVFASNWTPRFSSSALCASLGKLFGAVLVNFSPVVNTPLMLLVWLLTVTLLTCPEVTSVQNSLNGRLSELDCGH